MASSSPTLEQIKATRRPNIIAGNVTVAVAALIAVILRVISRRLKNIRLGPDDYTIFVALILALGITAANLIAAHYGSGLHSNTLSAIQISNEAKTFYASQVLWAVTIPVIKISILILYVRIFGEIRYFRIAAYALGVFSILWGMSVVLVVSFACRPFAYNWDKTIHGHCINQTLKYKITSGLNVATDFIILTLPLPTVWRLQTSIMHKVQLTGIFLLGSLTCSISLARWVSLFQLGSTDPTWELAIPCIWSAAEPCLGIVSACLATMKPLVQRLFRYTRTIKETSYAAGSHRSQGDSVKLNTLPKYSHKSESYARLHERDSRSWA